jgi:hypothetical protein
VKARKVRQHVWLRRIELPAGVGQSVAATCLVAREFWRIVHLTHMGRSCPDLDAELFFDVDEIHGAYLLTDVRQPATPKLNEVLRLIARLSGFLGRKGDGEPGAKAI